MASCHRARFWTLLLALAYLSYLSHALHSRLHDGRELIELSNGPAGVVWVVQLSDLHISSYHHDRAHSLKTLVGAILALINPALVLITGDLTDGKTKDRATMRQDEAEWVQYKEAIDTVVRQSGLPQHAFFDIRGNHDKFGVPEVGGRLDYFSKYSISALRNRTATVQSVTLLNGGWKHLFVGIDYSMGIGLRGPCNLHGHAVDKHLEMLDIELSQWDSCHSDLVTKIVYGHFPMSFTASTETGKRPEDVFAKHSISAYVCGHLHCKFGRNLFKHYLYSLPEEMKVRSKYSFNNVQGCHFGLQDSKPWEFWEWEMGDWRKSRMMRIIAIDEGHTSFVDLDLFDLDISSGDSMQEVPTIVLPTYPLDARVMQRALPVSLTSSVQDSVRALVFSPRSIVLVTAKIYDSTADSFILVQELEMQQLSKSIDRGQMFAAAWNISKFLDPSPTRYLLQITVIDSSGKQTVSGLRPFSVNGKIGKLNWTWREFLVMGIVWDALYKPLLLVAFCILLTSLIIPKLCYLYLVRKGNYNQWVGFIFRRNSRKWPKIIKSFELVLWVFIQGCKNYTLWWGHLLVVVYLMFLPWFWGTVLAEGYPAGYMSIWGWTVDMNGALGPHSGLGLPDVMVIVLPYLYGVLLPLFVLVFALSAERSFLQLHISSVTTHTRQKEQDATEGAVHGGHLDNPSLNGSSVTSDNMQLISENQEVLRRPEVESVDTGCEEHEISCKLCKRWIRKALLVGCLAVAFVHGQQTRAIVGAYGLKALLVSPGLAWPVPVLLVAAVLQTSTLTKYT